MTARDDDPELKALLASLRDDPPDDGFGARLHLRLAEAGTPAAPSASARLAAWLRERPWLVGIAVGGAAGVAAFALSVAVAGEPRLASVPVIAPSAAPPVCPPAALPAALPAVVEASAEVFVVPAGKVAMVQLHFAVERDIEEAEFSVLLPEGLAFFSDGAALPERAFHWVAPLSQGDNRVPIAVLGAQPGRHRLAATATIDGEVVVHEIVLDVKGPA